MNRRLRRVGLGLWVALILFLTLRPGPAGIEVLGGFCLVCGAFGWADVLRNVLLFIPLGIGLRAWGSRWPGALFLGLGLSAGVEALQLVIPGRDPSVSDLVFNVVGTGIGLMLAASARSWAFPTVGRERALRWMAGAGVALALLGSGVASHPILPEAGPFYGQWTPRVAGHAPYLGAIRGARVGALEVPSTRLRDVGRVTGPILAGTPLELIVEVGPAPERPAPLFKVVSGDGDGLFEVEVVGQDVIVELRTVASMARVGRGAFRVEGVLAGLEAGSVIQLTLWRDGGRFCGRAAPLPVAPAAAPTHASGNQAPCSPRPTVLSAWTVLFFSQAWSATRHRRMDALWAGLLLLPLGWWRPRTRWEAVALPLGIVGAAVAVVAYTFLAFPAPSAWVVGVLGGGLGWTLRQWGEAGRLG